MNFTLRLRRNHFSSFLLSMWKVPEHPRNGEFVIRPLSVICLPTTPFRKQRFDWIRRCEHGGLDQASR